MDKRDITVFFVSSYSVAFVLRDIEIIKKNFTTRVANFIGIRKTLKDTIKTVRIILKNLRNSDVAFIWFADFRALVTVIFAKILKKKSILVIGGYEVAHVPEISYGGTLNTILKKKISWIIHHAEVVLSVSEASMKELQEYYSFDNSQLIYNGVDTEKFNVDEEIGKENIAITVGYINDSNLLRKGIEIFVKASAYLPEVPFYVIGKYDEKTFDHLKTIASPNVFFKGFISQVELIKFYQKAKVYVQVSAHEGFGISLAEAMLCECVPVVTKRGALPEVAGKAGFYVPFNDPEETAKAIKQAIESNKGSAARNQILENFSMKRREVALTKIIRETLCK